MTSLRVKGLSGGILTIHDIHENITVSELKQIISRLSGFSVHKMELIIIRNFSATRLNDAKELFEYELFED